MRRASFKNISNFILPKETIAVMLSGALFIVFLRMSTIDASAGVKALPENMFFLKNNTSTPANCIIIKETRVMENFILSPGDENAFYFRYRSVSLICRPPVVQTLYRLRSGERYSILRDGNSLNVRRITVE